MNFAPSPGRFGRATSVLKLAGASCVWCVGLAALFFAACGGSSGANFSTNAGSPGTPVAGASGSSVVASGGSGAGNAAAGNAPGGSASGGANSAGSSGANGLAGQGGVPNAAAGSAGTATGADTPAPREIKTDTTGFRQFGFTARQADATVSDPDSHPDDMQRASVDTSKPLKKKLCLVLTGIGTGPGQGIGDWAGRQGFHVFQVGYSNAIGMAAKGDTNPDTPGNTRMNQFDGKGRTPSNAQTLPQDSIEGRTVKAIHYLMDKDPGGDWGWYLNADDTMRWSDGCFIGYSYGATHLAVIARYVRLGLAVSTSGPQSEGFPDATWIRTPSATPLERVFAIYGSEDGPDSPGHYNDTTAALGYLGNVLMTTTTADPGTPPYMNAHRIEVTGEGHTEFCAGNPPAYCQYMFGLPPY